VLLSEVSLRVPQNRSHVVTYGVSHFA